MTSGDGDEVASPNVPPADFAEQVHSALERLHDFPFLQGHPLAAAWQTDGTRPDELAGQRLRRELIDAVESLNPGREFAFLSPQSRLYNLLHMHYVDGMTIQKVSADLGISMRQAHRNLRRGEESVAMVMWARRPIHLAAPRPPGRALATAAAEVFEPHLRATDLCGLIERANKAVDKLAEKRGIALDTSLPAAPVAVWTDPDAAQQVWVSLLSRAIGQAGSGPLRVVLTAGDEWAHLELSYVSPADPGADAVWSMDPVVRDLAQKLDWNIDVMERSPNRCAIILRMPTHRPSVLIIDDNKGLVELLERYLTGQPCSVVAAHSGREGLKMAENLAPAAIILDVMMPEVDGWEVLQTLRSNLRTARTPIIICSVFDNPELALSLGATLHLLKPVRRDGVLDALRGLGII